MLETAPHLFAYQQKSKADDKYCDYSDKQCKMHIIIVVLLLYYITTVSAPCGHVTFITSMSYQNLVGLGFTHFFMHVETIKMLNMSLYSCTHIAMFNVWLNLDLKLSYSCAL